MTVTIIIITFVNLPYAHTCSLYNFGHTVTINWCDPVGIAIENLEDPGSEQIDLPASTTSQRKEHLRYSYSKCYYDCV